MTLKQKPWWLTIFTPPGAWVTIFPNIYVPDGINPNMYPAIVAHEETHLMQQRTIGKWAWLLRYFASRSFRLEQEAEAIAVELAHSPDYMFDQLRDRYAELLSTRYYWWAASSKNVAVKTINSKVAMASSCYTNKQVV